MVLLVVFSLPVPCAYVLCSLSQNSWLLFLLHTRPAIDHTGFIKTCACQPLSYYPNAHPRYGVFLPCNRNMLCSQRQRQTLCFVNDLSDTLLERTCVVIESSWAPKTSNRYASSLNVFLAFCDKHNISAARRLPADEELLCAFTASFASSHQRTTVQGHLSEVRAWHIASDATWYGSLRLRQTLKGVEFLAPLLDNACRPVTTSMISLFRNNLDLSIPLNACALSATICVFWPQLRLGEALSLWADSFISKYTPTVSCLGTPTTANDSLPLHLP